MKRVDFSIILMSLLVGMLVFASGVKLSIAVGGVYIRADGSIDPPTAPMQRDGDVYTLTRALFMSFSYASRKSLLLTAEYSLMTKSVCLILV